MNYKIDFEMILNFKFTLINDFNKILAKIIVRLEAIPNKTDAIKNRINKLKSMFIKIPANKINHEILN